MRFDLTRGRGAVQWPGSCWRKDAMHVRVARAVERDELDDAPRPASRQRNRSIVSPTVSISGATPAISADNTRAEPQDIVHPTLP